MTTTNLYFAHDSSSFDMPDSPGDFGGMIWDAIAGAISNIGNWFTSALDRGYEIVKDAIPNVLDGIETVVEVGVKLAGAGIGFFVGVAENLLGGLVNLGKSAAGGVIDLFRSVLGIEDDRPLPEFISPFKADLEGAIKPHLDNVKTALADSRAAGEKIVELNGVVDEYWQDVEGYREEQRQIRIDMEAINGEIGLLLPEVDAAIERMDQLQGEVGTSIETAESAQQLADKLIGDLAEVDERITRTATESLREAEKATARAQNAMASLDAMNRSLEVITPMDGYAHPWWSDGMGRKVLPSGGTPDNGDTWQYTFNGTIPEDAPESYIDIPDGVELLVEITARSITPGKNSMAPLAFLDENGSNVISEYLTWNDYGGEWRPRWEGVVVEGVGVFTVASAGEEWTTERLRVRIRKGVSKVRVVTFDPEEPFRAYVKQIYTQAYPDDPDKVQDFVDRSMEALGEPALTRIDVSYYSSLAEGVTELQGEYDATIGPEGTITKSIAKLGDDIEANAATGAQLTGEIGDIVDELGNKVNTTAYTARIGELQGGLEAVESRQESQGQEIRGLSGDLSKKVDATDVDGQIAATKRELIDNEISDALKTADTAIGWIENTPDIGTSLIALIPGTSRPRWSEGADEVTISGIPGITTAYSTEAGEGTKYPTPQYVAVDPSLTYRISFWARAEKPGSVIVWHLKDQDGNRALATKTSSVDTSEVPHSSNYAISYLDVPATWTKYEYFLNFYETAQLITSGSVYWQHPNGIKARQWIADLRIEPAIPSQADVDRAQNRSLKALEEAQRLDGEFQDQQREINQINKDLWEGQTTWNDAQLTINKVNVELWGEQNQWNKTVDQAKKAYDLLWKKQDEWNAGIDDFRTLQQEWNDDVEGWQATKTRLDSEQQKLQGEVDDAQNTATKSNTKAIEANTRILNMVFPAQSIVPMHPDEQIPAWEQAALYDSSVHRRDGVERDTGDLPGGVTSAIKVTATGSRTFKPNVGTRVAADPNIEYKYSFWAKADRPSTRMYIELRDQDGTHAVKKNTVDEKSPGNSQSTYIASNIVLSESWQKFSGTLTLRDEVRSVKIAGIYYSHPNGDPGTQWLADLQLTPNMPSQEQVDATQNTAIEANTKAIKTFEQMFDEQGGLNKLYSALEALGFQYNQEERDWFKTQEDLGHSLDGIKDAQDDIKEQNDKREASQAKATEELSMAVGAMSQYITRSLYVKSGRESKNKHWTVSMSGNTADFTAEPGWAGSAYIWRKSSGNGEMYIHEMEIGTALSSRKFTLTNAQWLMVHYVVEEGSVNQQLYRFENFYAGNSSGGAWANADGRRFTLHGNARRSITAHVEWSAANWHSNYGIRFLRNGSEIKRILHDRLGPLEFWGNGTRSQSLSVTAQFNDGDRLEVQVYSGGSDASERHINFIDVSIVNF